MTEAKARCLRSVQNLTWVVCSDQCFFFVCVFFFGWRQSSSYYPLFLLSFFVFLFSLWYVCGVQLVHRVLRRSGGDGADAMLQQLLVRHHTHTHATGTAAVSMAVG